MRPKGKEYVMWAPVPIVGTQGVPDEKPLRLNPEHYIKALRMATAMGKVTKTLIVIITLLVFVDLVSLTAYLTLVPFAITTRLLYLFGQAPGHSPHSIRVVIKYYKNHFHHS